MAPPSVIGDARSSLDALVREHLTRLSVVLGLLGLGYGAVHYFMLPEPANRGLALVFAGVGACVLFLFAGLEFFRLPTRWAESTLGVAACVGITATLLLMPLELASHHTIHLIFVLLAASLYFFSSRWMAGIVGYAIGGWLIVSLPSYPVDQWLYAGLGLAASALLGSWIQLTRRRSIIGLVGLRLRQAAGTEELAVALLDAESARRTAEAALAETELARATAESALRAAEKARLAAEESEDRYRLLSEVSFEGILVREGGRIEHANRAMARMLGYERPEQIVGRHLLDFSLPENRERDRKSLQEAPAGPVEHVLVHRDGHAISVLTQGRNVEHGGRALRVLAVQDLSGRREVEQRLLLADRLVSMGALAAGVAHEINNPLAYILANLAHLERQLDRAVTGAGLSNPEGLLAAVRDARDGAERVRRIVRDLKTFARGDEEPVGPVDLAGVVDTAVKLTWNELRHRARLVVDAASVRPVRANASRLGQVLVNLLMNAAQAIPEGEADRNEIRLTVREGAEGMVIGVADTGCGIRAEHAARIFEPFFTTKPEGEGTGLGLSICHGLVTRMGGSLSMESRVGEGTRFWVVLPAAGEATPAEPRLQAPTVAQRQAGARILIVDDEPNVGEILQKALVEHDVQVALSGHEAVARCRENAFDLILLDLMMPELTGMDVYEVLLRDDPAAAERVVFMTGGAFTPRAKAFLAGVPNRCLEKPFDLSEIDSLANARPTVSQPDAA